MSETGVTFKATVNGLIIIMREEDDFETVFDLIEKKIASAGKFFKDATLQVKYRGKSLTKSEEEKIFKLLSEKSGATIKSFDEDLEDPVKAQNAQDTGFKKSFFKGISEGMTKFYRGTVRSGQLVNYNGNLVVIGDVNPGGEVVATGNVVVMGSLRGMAFAGADGNKEAVVVALNLQPMQLRIGDVIARAPDEAQSRTQFIPEIAFVKEDMVYIERFLPQR